MFDCNIKKEINRYLRYVRLHIIFIYCIIILFNTYYYTNINFYLNKFSI
jgi:hypothetical protein